MRDSPKVSLVVMCFLMAGCSGSDELDDLQVCVLLIAVSGKRLWAPTNARYTPFVDL